MKMIKFQTFGDDVKVAVNPALVTVIEEGKVDNTTKIYFTGGENDFIRVDEPFKNVLKKFQEV